MPEPTKADLKAAAAKLTTENAQLAKENTALLELLAAARAYAAVPHPADYANHKYPIELENRLDSIAIWANADRDDMIQDVYLPVLAYRAKELRERAAKPVRYEVRAEPEPAATVPAPNPPHHAFRTDERECTAQGYEDADSGYVCTSQEGHDGPDHIAWNPGGGEYHRWPIAEPAPSGMQDPAPVVRVIDVKTPELAERFISGSPFCPATRGIPGQGGDLCELPLKHGGDHRAPGNEEGDPDITWSDEPRGYLRCEDTSPAGGFTCTLKLKHEGLHSQLALTGAFMAEWGYADGHVHTTAEPVPVKA